MGSSSAMSLLLTYLIFLEKAIPLLLVLLPNLGIYYCKNLHKILIVIKFLYYECAITQLIINYLKKVQLHLPSVHNLTPGYGAIYEKCSTICAIQCCAGIIYS